MEMLILLLIPVFGAALLALITGCRRLEGSTK